MDLSETEIILCKLHLTDTSYHEAQRHAVKPKILLKSTNN